MLSDYRILDLTDTRGALCGQLLADLGADVLRIEPPGGSPLRRNSTWSIYARNSKSLVLDVESPDSRAQLEQLAHQADLVLANNIVVGKLVFADLRKHHPGLVWLAITAFGIDGPKATYQATDLVVQAAGGAMAINGFDDAKPLRTGAVTAWSHAGVAAAGAALLALRQRDASGRGQLVDISAQLSVNLTAAYSLLTPFIGADRMRRRAKQDPVQAMPLIWPAKDGFVSLTLGFAGPMMNFARNLFAWMREAEALEDRLANLDWPSYLEQLRNDNADRNNLHDLLAQLGRFLAARGKSELLADALVRGVLLVPVSSTHDVLNSPQLAARKFWWTEGNARQPGPFAHFSAEPLRLRTSAPAYDPDAAAEFSPRPLQTTRLSANLNRPELPLAGVKILDFSWVMAGPWCTRVLADYGATVVKVESSTRMDLVRVLGPFYNNQFSSETSASFASINAGKLSIELDPNQPEDKTKLLALVDWADIVMESFSPKAMKKWGLDYAYLQARKPGIIMLSSCLFGQTGPLATMAGYGTMGAAFGGLVLPTGIPDRPPCGPFGPYTDFVAPRFSVLALLAALHHRDRTGQGQHIDQSQAECSMLLMSPAITASSLGAPAPDRLGNEDPDMCPHDVYPCTGDDQWVAIAVRDEQDWRALCAELDKADWGGLGLGARRSVRADIDEAIATWTQTQSAAAVEARLQSIGVPAHAVMNAALATEDPQLAHRKHFQTTTHPRLGSVHIESAGFALEHAEPSVGKVPSLGGDEHAVLTLLETQRKSPQPGVG